MRRYIKAVVYSSNGDTDFFENVAGVLQRDTLAPNLFIICLDYVLQLLIDLIKENGFRLKKKQVDILHKLVDADNIDDLALLTNTPVQAKSLLRSLKQATGIGLYVNAGKTEFICFKQDGAISTLKSKPLKLVD